MFTVGLIEYIFDRSITLNGLFTLFKHPSAPEREHVPSNGPLFSKLRIDSVLLKRTSMFSLNLQCPFLKSQR